MAALNRLEREWRNRADESMQVLLERLLALKDERTYEQVFADLVLREHKRHVENIEYLARLMYLIDERPMPILHLQPAVGLDQGHIYRTLKRAGVVFEAPGSRSAPDGYFPWKGEVYVDPIRRVLLRGGEEEEIPEDSDPYDLPIQYERVTVPLPLWPRLRLRRRDRR